MDSLPPFATRPVVEALLDWDAETRAGQIVMLQCNIVCDNPINFRLTRMGGYPAMRIRRCDRPARYITGACARGSGPARRIGGGPGVTPDTQLGHHLGHHLAPCARR